MLLIADTAGRLPTQLHLMEELQKVKRVIERVMPDAPHEVMLVLDANTGQNAVSQVQAFDEALGLTGRELFSIEGVEGGEAHEVTVRADEREFQARVRLDTPRERDYYRHGGILRFVLRRLLASG